jgi:hypothetical protein
MNTTDQIRDEFNKDNIRHQGDTIQVYWFVDRNGPWVSFDGGPLKGGIAKRNTYAFAKQVHDQRDRLPVDLQELTVEVGEMTADGNFSALAIHKFVPVKKELPE